MFPCSRPLLALAALLTAACHDWSSLSSTYEAGGPQACVAVAYVVAGDTHTCARRADGTLLCWGDNRFGQLGTNNTTPATSPTLVDMGGASVAKLYLPAGTGDISADTAVFTCALRADGSLACWGANRFGQLGTGGTEQHLAPTVVTSLGTNVLRASAGAGQVCAQTNDQMLWCWGNNQFGELGIGSLTPPSETKPTQVSTPNDGGPPDDGGMGSVDSLACGGSHSCAATTDNSLWCWGDNTYSQLGITTTGPQLTPASVTSVMTKVAKASAGAKHTCVIETDATVWCWGSNQYGQLGTNDLVSRATPTQVDPTNLDKATQIYAGGTFTCALKADGTLWCWGDNRLGQLGTGDNAPRTTPTQVAPSLLANRVSSAYAGGAHACAVTTDGAVWCWGSNQYGQLAAGTAPTSSAPVQVLPACP